MTHLHKASGLYFECGELMEFPTNGTRQTFDMTVITLWGCTEGDPEAPIIVDYYFGEYNPEHTDYYIDQWLQKQAIDNEWLKIVGDCQDIVSAYWLTNEDVLEGDMRNKVQRTLTNLKRILEVITNETIPCQ